MNGWPLPGPIIEAGNWMMVVLFAAIEVSAIIYFWGELRRHHWRFLATYASSKASFAVATMFFGLLIRTLDVALVRHFQNHGRPVPWDDFIPTTILLVSTVPIVWGSICWMRAVMPLRCWPWAWAVLAIGAVVVGGLMAW